MTKELAIQANSSSLSKALKNNADSAVILRHAMQLSVAKVIDTRANYLDLKFKIDAAERNLIYWQNVTHIGNKQMYVNAVKLELKRHKTAIRIVEYPALIMELRKANEANVKKSLQLLIISLLKYYQTTEQIPNEMIGLIADRILWKFGGLSLEDVAVCFNMAMNGDLGKVYNRIDGGVIMSWLQSYTQRQQEVIYAKNVVQHTDAKGSTYKDYNEHRKLVPERLQMPTELREKKERAKKFNKRNG